MRRLDLALVELGLAPTRSKAQQLIAAGEVEIFQGSDWKMAGQASLHFTGNKEHIRLVPEARTLKYVSRGGLKLEGALDHLKLEVRGDRCLDLGLSTGGFTDCLLARGAAAVCGIDVGHGQLHARLKGEPRLLSLEGINAKEMQHHPGITAWLREGLDLVVVDLSFISLLQVFPHIAEISPSGSKLLALVKPQFEVGADNLDKRGVVRDDKLFEDVEGRVLHALDKCGFSIQEYFPSQVKGQDGNQEFFVFAHRS